MAWVFAVIYRSCLFAIIMCRNPARADFLYIMKNRPKLWVSRLFNEWMMRDLEAPSLRNLCSKTNSNRFLGVAVKLRPKILRLVGVARVWRKVTPHQGNGICDTGVACKQGLLDFYLRSSGFKLTLNLFGFLLGTTFFKWSRCTLNQFLGIS